MPSLLPRIWLRQPRLDRPLANRVAAVIFLPAGLNEIFIYWT